MKIKILTISVLFFAAVIACRDNKQEVTPNPDIPELEGSGPYQPTLPYYFGDFRPMPADNPLTYEGVRLGRRLFYEKMLSGDNSMSCASCHQQKLAFTDGRAQSRGITGEQTPVGSMSLSNLLWVNRFHWNGKFTSLEAQALAPIQNPREMNQSLDQTLRKLQQTSSYPPLFEKAFGSRSITSENLGKALAQFVRTLVSSNSKYDRFLLGRYTPTASERRGITLFATHPDPAAGVRGGNCGDCHLGSLLTGDPKELRGFHNNGLDNEAKLKPGLQEISGQAFDRGKFRAPSLRNIALTAPYMHDGRFKTLEEVLDHYNEHIQQSSTLDPQILAASNQPISDPTAPVKLYLTEQEKKDIIAFMNMLTDSTFITNPLFSDPFKK